MDTKTSSPAKKATKNPAKSATKAVAAPVRRKYDVVLYGASGFVGRQTVEYFAKLWAQGGTQVTWALAGRSAAKMAEVKATYAPDAKNIAIIVADALDAKALDRMTQDATVVLSTAGPFAIFGSELVASCVRNGTHYVDITGEIPWVRVMIDKHHQAAVANGTRIIPFCGFDSVPSDLGAWMMTQAMLARHGEKCASVKASYAMRGGVNGGTLASAVNMLGSELVQEFEKPYLLNPRGQQPADTSLDMDPTRPVNDPDFKAWQGPFVMGPINTRVVRRSAQLLGYGPDFHYQEYMRFGAGPIAGALAAGFCASMAAGKYALTFKPVQKLTEKLMPGPGKGPSEWMMNRGSYTCQWVATSTSGKVLRGLVADKGDPGNRATTKMVCEAALCLALQLKDLPGGVGFGGFLTPASGLGNVLLERLRAAGMTLRVD